MSTQYVIRSMSTTSYDHRVGEESIIPYHIYLMPPAKRGPAFWSGMSAVMIFNSFEAALAERRRCGLNGAQIVPSDYRGPAYWEKNADVE